MKNNVLNKFVAFILALLCMFMVCNISIYAATSNYDYYIIDYLKSYKESESDFVMSYFNSSSLYFTL